TRRVGEIQQRLGAFQEAEATYRRALETIGAWETAGRAASAEDRYEQALAHNRLGWLLWMTGRSGEADFRAALDLIDPLVQPPHRPLRYRREQAMAHSSLGLQLMGLGQFREAEAEHRAALGLREELARIVPDEYQADLSRTWLNLGLLLKQVGRFD